MIYEGTYRRRATQAEHGPSTPVPGCPPRTVEAPEPDLRHLVLADPAIGLAASRLSAGEHSLAEQRRLFKQLSSKVQTLKSLFQEKERRNFQMRQACLLFPEEVLMDLQEQREVRLAKSQMEDEKKELARGLAQAEKELQRRVKQLQKLRSLRQSALKGKRDKQSKLYADAEKAGKRLGQAEADQVVAQNLIAEKKRDPRFEIKVEEDRLEQVKEMLLRACQEEDRLQTWRKEVFFARAVARPHIQFVKAMEKEIGKFYFQWVGGEEEDEEQKWVEERLQKTSESLEKERRRMAGLIEQMNALAGQHP